MKWEKDQLISMIHFLEKRDEVQKQENLELMELIKALQDTHKQDVKTQASLLKTQSNLMASIDNLTRQVADLTNQNRMLSERIAELAQTFPSRD